MTNKSGCMVRITWEILIMENKMTDVEVMEDDDSPDTILNIPIVKGKESIAVSTKKTPEHVYRAVLILGYKALLNRGMTKLTKEAYPDPEALQAKAMELAEKALENLYAGKVRLTGGSKEDGKVPREVQTEARRMAKNLVKQAMKAEGMKVSYVESSTITQAVNALLADPDEGPKVYEQARKEVERVATAKVKIDLSGISISQKKLKAAESRKADKTLSAQKAGKVATRARPQL